MSNAIQTLVEKKTSVNETYNILCTYIFIFWITASINVKS